MPVSSNSGLARVWPEAKASVSVRTLTHVSSARALAGRENMAQMLRSSQLPSPASHLASQGKNMGQGRRPMHESQDSIEVDRMKTDFEVLISSCLDISLQLICSCTFTLSRLSAYAHARSLANTL